MLTVLLIFWPLIAALIIIALKEHSRTIALFASLVELIIALVVAFSFVPNEVVQFAVNVPWIQSIGVHFNVGIDGISLLLVLLTTGLVPFIILSSFNNSYKNPHTFYCLILLMQMALVGVFVALDGFLFYLFWEMALIPIYFICLIWGGEDRGRITLKFFIYTLAGSLVMLIGLVYLYFHTLGTHTFEIQALYEAGRSLTPFEQGILFWAFFVAFAIKMPVFPFHTWQPDTYTVSPAQGTMLLSAIMLKMGIYGVIRWLIPVVPLGVQAWGLTAIILSVVGIVYASIIALMQKDFKRLIAYSSIAHVGLISAGIFTLSKMGIQGAMVQMVSHGIVVFALFYVVEIISQRAKTREINQLGGIRHQAPILSSVFLVILLGSIALPFTSGFVGEFLLINSLVSYQLTIGAIAGLTTILGAVYMLRSFQQSMLGETNVVTATILDLTSQEKFVLYPIVVLIVVIGIYPAPLLKISEAAVNNLLTIVSNYLALAN
ncbi:MAG: NuoM family protein [Cyclobacteriaceae bacterium]